MGIISKINILLTWVGFGTLCNDFRKSYMESEDLGLFKLMEGFVYIKCYINSYINSYNFKPSRALKGLTRT